MIHKIDKSKPIYGLEKIPDFILLKEANVEIGKLQAYIQELEDKLRFYKNNETVKTMAQLVASNTTLKTENKSLRKTNADLLENILKERRKSNL